MRYFLAFFLLTLAIGIAFAGQGCGPFSGDGVCDHHCKNCVLTKSSDPCPEGCDNDCQVATSKPISLNKVIANPVLFDFNTNKTGSKTLEPFMKYELSMPYGG
ncbi:hypothetical protein F8M41_006703 [Gigaspora margarita]|uniref:Uncharacterized protein n=1 Tax=Gigaspora margarita TaxID=4874 RepID=A0A8H4A4W8_GIGMA|nr:hypothetical protein F8M41_006703 [Gigaspora margarita]